MKRRIASGIAALGSGLSLVCALPAPAALPSPPACITIAVSPNFAHDGTAACARLVIQPTSVLTVDVTTNHGRTWSQAAATGLTWGTTSQFVAQPLFSPRYAADHRIYIATDVGLFVTSDLGKTFTLADASIHALTPTSPMLYLGGAGGLSALWTGQRMFAVGLGTVTRRLDTASGVDLPVVGSPNQSVEQLLGPNPQAPTAPIYALTQASVAGGTAGLWTCDDNLACATQLASFPRLKPSRLWEAPLAHRGYALLVFGLATDGSSHLLRSTDTGRTFKPVSQIDGIFKTIDNRAVAPMVGLAMNPRYPGLVFMRVEGFPAGKRRPGDPPAEQIYRSSDGGATWQRIGYQWGIMQAGPTGNVPFNMMSFGYPAGAAPIELTDDGHLLVPAQLEEYTAAGLVDLDGVYCSLDLGKTWHRSCSR